MPKHEFMTPKAIANRIKAKGLQKLRWYCQMCEKQCRDENGFKCHCMSESHQRQMQVFGQNPGKFIGTFSRDFEDAFMEHLKRSHRSSRVAATVVYNEYIADRNHVHMNASRWATLTDFVKYLGRAGKCKVEETPKGWFMTYIDREPETLLKENQKKKRLKADMAEEERHEREIESMRERASKTAKLESASSEQVVEPSKEALQRDENGKIAFSLGGPVAKLESKVASTSSAAATNHTSVKPSAFEEKEEDNATGPSSNSTKKVTFVKKETRRGGVGALDELMKEQELAKERKNRKDYWLCEGLVVKVMAKKLAAYYKQKGTVRKVINKYVGEIEMIESGHVLKVDQAELETVIPQIGGLVRIVNGAYRDSNARLLSIDEAKFCAKVQIEKGAYDGRVVPAIAYEDICKLSVQ